MYIENMQRSNITVMNVKECITELLRDKTTRGIKVKITEIMKKQVYTCKIQNRLVIVKACKEH